MMSAAEWADHIRDHRGRRVVFLAHCLLNDGSPSCGVGKCLDVKAAIDRVGQLRPTTATAPDVNAVVRGTLTNGPGLFIEALQRELVRRGASVPIIAHDIVEELDGRTSPSKIVSLVELPR